jgi:hypothetical protein
VELYIHCPNTLSWRGAQLRKAQGKLYLYLTFTGDKFVTCTILLKEFVGRRETKSESREGI